MKPSLDLTAIVESLDGTEGESFPVSANRDSENQMFVQSFSNKLNVGYENFTGLIPRDFRKTYGSPRILQNLRVVDAGGNTVWEGRVDNVPPGRNNSVTAVGWYDSLKDSSGVAEVYADADMGKWGEPPAAEKLRIVTAGIDISSLSWSNENGNLFCSYPAQSLPAQCTAAAWYQAPPGCLIASVDYTGSETSPGPTGYLGPRMYFQPADSDGGVSAVTVTLDSTDRNAVPANGVATRWVSVNVYSNASATTPTAGMHRKYTALKAIGDHGLSSIYASEVIKHAIGKYCPQITADSNSVYDTTYEIGQLVFDGGTVDDVVTRCNAFHLCEMGVWRDRTFWFQPQRDTTDYDYLLSIYEGDGLDIEGPRIDDNEPCNGVWVYYTSVTTQRRERVGPLGDSAPYDTDGDSSLLVTDDENPCNREGQTRFPSLEISFPCSSADAIQLGALWLAEKQVPVSIGTGTAVGHVKNRAGAWVPAHNIESGDRIKFTHEDVIRRVYSANYSPSSATCSLAFERPPATFEGINERIEHRLQARNIG